MGIRNKLSNEEYDVDGLNGREGKQRCVKYVALWEGRGKIGKQMDYWKKLNRKICP